MGRLDNLEREAQPPSSNLPFNCPSTDRNSVGLEIRAAIDTETVKTLLPLIVEKPGLKYLAVGAVRGLIFTAVGLVLAVYHNRLRRKCNLEYDKFIADRKRPCRWVPTWMHSVPHEPCICTRSVAAMWLSLVAFVLAAGFVVTGALRQLDHPAPAPPPSQHWK